MLGFVLTAYKNPKKQWLKHIKSTFLTHTNRCGWRSARNGTTVPLSTGTQHSSFFLFHDSTTWCHPQGNLTFQNGCQSSSHPISIPGSRKGKEGQNKSASSLLDWLPANTPSVPPTSHRPPPAAREAFNVVLARYIFTTNTVWFCY